MLGWVLEIVKKVCNVVSFDVYRQPERCGTNRDRRRENVNSSFPCFCLVIRRDSGHWGRPHLTEAQAQSTNINLVPTPVQQ